MLWGMRMVRTGIERAYDSDLRQIVARSVSNRLRALRVGIGVTAVLQSSTATALMVASFCAHGLMATAPALAVMLGADVGTTLVAQVLSFDVFFLSPGLIAVGFVVHSMAERTRPRQLGRAALGLGLMLLALKLIVATSEPLRESEVLREVLGSMVGERTIAVLVAALLTWLAHSSLAVVLLIMAFAHAGTVPMDLAFALVLGANLGGTLAPILATLAEGAVARRVTFGNAAFKLIGVAAVLPAIDVVQPAIAWLGADATRQVVNFHTAFNLAIAVVFIGFTGLAAKLAERLLPVKPAADDPGRPKHLERASLTSPPVALAAAAREALRVGDVVESMLKDTIKALKEDDGGLAHEIMVRDDTVDRLYEAIKLYVTEISRHELDSEEGRRATQILTFTTDLEHIGDIIENLMELAGKKSEQGVRFSEDGLAELEALHAKVAANMKLALVVFMSGDERMALRLLQEKREVVELERADAARHLARLREGRRESIETSALHMDVLRDLKRIHSHIVAVAYPVLAQAGLLEPKPPTDKET
ncbi:MAG: Na/Pi cotransporter family protein [Rhodospirillales bacterium]|nr:Na/Pi cotransporter family protein [Rhodospirillales bacterium]